jgi:hypothetical protein
MFTLPVRKLVMGEDLTVPCNEEMTKSIKRYGEDEDSCDQSSEILQGFAKVESTGFAFEKVTSDMLVVGTFVYHAIS